MLREVLSCFKIAVKLLDNMAGIEYFASYGSSYEYHPMDMRGNTF